MSKPDEILFLHVGAVAFLGLYLWTIKGRFAEKTYEWREKFAPFMLLGYQGKKEKWVRHQKFIMHVGLTIFAFGYILTLVMILRH